MSSPLAVVTGGSAHTGSAAHNFPLPARPALLMALQKEMSKDVPHLNRVTEIIKRDPALAGSFLSVSNSPLFYTRRQIKGISEAVALIGMDHSAAVVMGLLTRRLLSAAGTLLPRFWDVSEKRAKGLIYLADQTRALPAADAHSFGLFCDIGIPLMMAQFSNYRNTLADVNQVAAEQVLLVEGARHGTNHSYVGASMAAAWELPEVIVDAIRAHHTPFVMADPAASTALKRLLALNLIVEKAIQEFRGEDESLEWRAGGESYVPAVLGLSTQDIKELCDILILRFASGTH